MSQKSKKEYLEICRQRYPSRGRAGKSAMIDEVCDTLGWGRKHAIKALGGKVCMGGKGAGRGAGATHGPVERQIIVSIWRSSEQPCGTRLKATLPLWMDSHAQRHGRIDPAVRKRILGYSARTLDRITAPHRAAGGGARGRKTGRCSNRIKQFVPVRCGPQQFDEPGWMEADTVSHGGGSSGGTFLWTLTLTDFHSGWTELAALWGNGGGEVCMGLERIERRLPFGMLGFDCDNGSEFLNEILERYLTQGRRRAVAWTRCRPYRKNDQAHVEQKNFTHVRQLLGYGRFGDIGLRSHVESLYAEVWLPLRNHFTPVMKLVSKQRVGGKVRKRYDRPATPCDRLLACPKVGEETKAGLRAARAGLDPLVLAEELEKRLAVIFGMVERLEEERRGEMERAGELPPCGPPVADCVAAPVASAPCASTPSATGKNLAKPTRNNHQHRARLVS